MEKAMTQDELGRDRLLRAVLRRAEPSMQCQRGTMLTWGRRALTQRPSGLALLASLDGRTSVSSVRLNRTRPSRARPV